MMTCSVSVISFVTDDDDDDEVTDADAKRNPFDVEIPGDCGYVLRMESGVMHVYRDAVAMEADDPVWEVPDRLEFLNDQNILFMILADGPL